MYEFYSHGCIDSSHIFARALSQLSELYGRVGLNDEAFNKVEIMRSIPDVHPNFLSFLELIITKTSVPTALLQALMVFFPV